jgi:hypothetical protein
MVGLIYDKPESSVEGGGRQWKRDRGRRGGGRKEGEGEREMR